MAASVYFDSERTQREIDVLSRAPFRRLLARIMAHAPSDEALETIAERNPDRWAQTATQIARLGGYNERLEVEGSLNVSIQELSDSELVAQLAVLVRTLDMQTSDIEPLRLGVADDEPVEG